MLVLLDIDGVMLPANAWRVPEILSDDFPAFSTKAIKALQRIVDQTGADILITSSHKERFSAVQWRNIFAHRGIKLNGIDTLPDNVNRSKRADEILAWYDNRANENHFVIIDDDKALNALPPHLKSRLILTSSSIGLTDELANEAIRVLRSEQSFAFA